MLTRSFLVLAMASVAGGSLWAQAPKPAAPTPIAELRRDAEPSASPGSVPLTPEMWLYQQERDRYDDPKSAVRQKAEFRAAQRENRIAALNWMRIYPSRPAVNGDPYFYSYRRPLYWRPYEIYPGHIAPGGLSGPSLRY